MPNALVMASQPSPMERTLSWGEVDWMIEVAVAHMRHKRYRPRVIIPVGGGGIIPAAIMAYRFYKKDDLPITLHPPVYARSYDPEHQQHRLQIHFPPQIEFFDDVTTLFVDDIVDSGATYEACRERMPNCSFFSLVTKITGHPDWYSTLDRENQWWNFPWEKVPPAEGPKSQDAA
jgi:hypoxanthine phosphoribosyltransferase